MRIIQINATYNVGSTGVITADIHNLLLSNGFESYVAYAKTNLPKGQIKNGYKVGSFIGNKLHALLCRIGGKQGYFSRLSTLRLISFIKRINPDIVHLHNLHSNYINLNLLLKFLAKSNIRTVITLHDSWFYTGGCFSYAAVGCNRWQYTCGRCPQRLVGTKALLFDSSKKILKDRKKYLTAIKNLDVVGVSNWIASEAESTFLSQKNIFTVYNGIDTSFFKPVISNFKAKMNLENKFVILGFADKWLKCVNKSLLYDMCAYLKEDMAFVLVGCTKESEKQLPKGVIPLPYIKERETLRAIYSACDVFANCTREDSFALVNAEAQACGTPVVVFNNTGAAGTVSDSFGFKAQNGDNAAFIDGIDKVYKMGKEAFTKGAIDFVKENFDRKKNYKKYLKLYKGGDVSD